MFRQLAIIILSLPFLNAAPDCSKQEYDSCVRIADPLVKEPHLVFPDNLNDIDLVCRTWNRFVDCLKLYTDNCFTDQQRKQFNRAVESPIESVHEMCMIPNYQQEYLQYAPCIKSTITERAHCGQQYNLLVDQVEQGDIISKSTLCCSHDRFKHCVQTETRRLCDRGVNEGQASKFALQILDKALSFLQDQCYNYIPNSGDCFVTSSDSHQFSDPVMISTSSSEIYPWSTNQEIAPKEMFPSRMTPPKVSTMSSWLPSSESPSDIVSPSDQNTQMLGSRTRPASYGRASSWPDTSNPVVGNTVQMYPENPSTPSSRPDWATVSSWNAMGQNPGSNGDPVVGTFPSRQPSSPREPAITSSTTWYPAAGSQISNEVDEPNQQGLRKPKNSAPTIVKVATVEVFSVTVLAMIASFC